ncbi:ribosomal protein l32 [Ophiostoma piceae UAMH 11346]|uniref:Ribosomal protein l32 n=1 Tax=Ophiostoma piceae (strain UAMH 11346) TaxID=1262450 RepID=S3CHE6_OPHP1|nr:ribosomal protein l32 [Ophiostoma piceae UAMH 11346]
MTVATITISPSDGADGAMAVTEKTIPGSAPTCLCPQCGSTVDIPALHLATSTSTSASGDAEAQLQQAREQVSALQSQVSHLDQKAAAAIDRWADYEDELTLLRRQLAAVNGPGGTRPQSRPTPTIVPPPSSAGPPGATPVTPVSPTRTSFLPTGAANRISALLSPRSAKSTSNLKETAAQQYSHVPTAMPTPPPSTSNGSNNNNYDYMHASTPAYSVTPVTTPPPPRTPYGSFSIFGGKIQTQSPHQQLQQQPQSMSPSTKELMDALTREQKLRRAAEGRLNDTSREVEELSVSLFEQANEMVAEERRARARLEARVAVLEQRDTDKKARLERLELAMARIERLRAMLGDDANSDAASPKPDAASFSTELEVEQHGTSLRKLSLTAAT